MNGRAIAAGLGLALAALAAGCGRTVAGPPAEGEAPSGTTTPTATAAASWDFEDVAVGEIPSGWRIEATRPQGPPATWQVVEAADAPSGTHVLALTSPNHRSRRTFNMCWTDDVSFADGTITVRFKALSGRTDQGGGVIWRAQDHDNYYIARFNPLEDNFRIYFVRGGARRQLASARIALAPGWHEMKIEQHGDRFAGFLDGRKLLEGRDDHFPGRGGVGLWTKADAATSFDDLVVRPETETDRAQR